MRQPSLDPQGTGSQLLSLMIIAITYGNTDNSTQTNPNSSK